MLHRIRRRSLYAMACFVFSLSAGAAVLGQALDVRGQMDGGVMPLAPTMNPMPTMPMDPVTNAPVMPLMPTMPMSGPMPGASGMVDPSSQIPSNSDSHPAAGRTDAGGGLFTDVGSDSPYHDALSYLVERGIVSGHDDGSYRPNATINRAEFTKIIVRSRFTEDDIGVCRRLVPVLFKDVAPTADWFAPYVCLAKAKGFVTGYLEDQTFRPANRITFAEAAAIVARSQGLADARAKSEPWFRDAVTAVLDRRAAPSTIAHFHQEITRGEMAEMIYRLLAEDTTRSSPTYAELERETKAHAARSAASGGGAVAQTSAEGYQTMKVQTAAGEFAISVLRADLSDGVEVVTDSAESYDCPRDCAAIPLEEYVRRNGGYAGINGTYFCPPDYPHCANETNSFIYFLYSISARRFLHEDKRDYDNAGSLFVFRRGSIDFYADPTSFTIDANVTGAIASWPTLMIGGRVQPNHRMMDQKQLSHKGPRAGIGRVGNVAYFVHVKAATVPDLALVMEAMGMEDAINLDGGGSSALYAGGYKIGQGRKLPNAIILRK
jgi:exopolysaccharide biosynthesis protein